MIPPFLLSTKQLSAVRLFAGADFISAEFTDIYFEVKAVISFDFLCVQRCFPEKCQCSARLHCRQPF